MPAVLCKRHQFPPAIIQHAVWLYLRFTLSYRNVEDLLSGRGVDVSDGTARRWVLRFSPKISHRLRRLRQKPSSRWHLDEMVIRTSGKQLHLWRAVDDEAEALEILVQRRRDRIAAGKLMRTLLKMQGFARCVITTDKLRSYRAAFSGLGFSVRHEQCLRKNNRAEVSHQPDRRRERTVQRLKSHGSAQLFLSMHAAVYNAYNSQRHLISRQRLGTQN